MAKKVKSKIGLLKVFNSCSAEVQNYYEHLPKLLEDFPLDVGLAYCFARLELGQNMALYCGVVKMYRANAALARNAIGTHYMTRESFGKLYKTVYGLDLPVAAAQALKTAEDTRDTVMHGKTASADRLRNAIARVLEYSDAINKQLSSKAGLKPFGDLRGFAGALTKLDKRTTRFMLKGMDFTLS